LFLNILNRRDITLLLKLLLCRLITTHTHITKHIIKILLRIIRLLHILHSSLETLIIVLVKTHNIICCISIGLTLVKVKIEVLQILSLRLVWVIIIGHIIVEIDWEIIEIWWGVIIYVIICSCGCSWSRAKWK